jgi:short-subunit dehydrogenase
VNLSGETVLVTGASGGIGGALVEELATRDVRVLAGVRDLDRFEPPPASRALEVRPVLVDLSSRESIEASATDLGDDLQQIGVLVNNAGVFEGGRLEDERLDAIYELIQVNLAAMIHLTQIVLPAMLRRGRGKIVNNASIAGYVHFPGSAPYAASKAGVVAFSESLRRELRGSGVGVTHLVTPGVATDMMDETEAAYEPFVKDASGWGHNEPADWAAKVVKGIEDDDAVVGPGGPEALAKLASRGPGLLVDAIAGAAFDREGK